MRRILVVVLTASAASVVGIACDEGPPLARSCAGKAITNCLPYEYSIITSAEISPEAIEVGGPSMPARVQVELETCGSDAPQPHDVQILALSRSSDVLDAGSGSAVFTLAEVSDDGEDGDETARDGLIDVMIDNPFFTDLPEETELTLRFVPTARIDCSSGTCRGGTCRGEAFETTYTTGQRFDP